MPLKKTITLLLITSIYIFASDYKYLSYNMTDMHNNSLRKATVVDFALNFSAIESNNKDYPIALCREDKKLDIKSKTYLANDSINLSCKGSSDNKSTACILKIYNVNYDDKKINNMLNKKICRDYSPKAIVQSYKFKLNLNSSNEIILDNKYKFKYTVK